MRRSARPRPRPLRFAHADDHAPPTEPPSRQPWPETINRTTVAETLAPPTEPPSRQPWPEKENPPEASLIHQPHDASGVLPRPPIELVAEPPVRTPPTLIENVSTIPGPSRARPKPTRDRRRRPRLSPIQPETPSQMSPPTSSPRAQPVKPTVQPEKPATVQPAKPATVQPAKPATVQPATVQPVKPTFVATTPTPFSPIGQSSRRACRRSIHSVDAPVLVERVHKILSQGEQWTPMLDATRLQRAIDNMEMCKPPVEAVLSSDESVPMQARLHAMTVAALIRETLDTGVPTVKPIAT